jgi:hypothetical protein
VTALSVTLRIWFNNFWPLLATLVSTSSTPSERTNTALAPPPFGMR